MKVIFGVLFLAASSQAFLFGKSVYPDWDKLSVTFGSFSTLPKTVKDAQDEGWSEDGTGCSQNGTFIGRRFSQKGNAVNMLMFDNQGNVAGLQMALPVSKMEVPANHVKAYVRDGDYYLLTAYFTDPDTICSGKRATEDGYVGDNLYLVMQEGVVKIPLQESELVGTKWTIGRCFAGMGQHYWYNTSADMDCNDFAPFFLLYNGGNLNAFGFATNGNLVDDRVEHPDKNYNSYFFREVPKCFNDYDALTTQHVYLQRKPSLNLCYFG